MRNVALHGCRFHGDVIIRIGCRDRMGRFIVILVALTLTGAVACSESPRPPTGPSPRDDDGPPIPRGQTAVLAVVGDIGWCGPNGPVNAVAQTARVAESIDGQVVLAGDLAYMNGTPQDFQRCFEPSWGQFRPRWRPTPGNHEYHTPDAAGYFQYFGEAATPANRSFYAFRAGDWLVLMINSNIDARAGSEQYEFVRSQLERHSNPCTLAVWHHPLFSSGPNGSNMFMSDMWAVLDEHKADVVVAGHDHLYERFGKQDVRGRSTPEGIRQFIAGTGGAELYDFLRVTPNSQIRIKSHGVLRLTLRPANYDWAFLDATGNVLDADSDGCH